MRVVDGVVGFASRTLGHLAAVCLLLVMVATSLDVARRALTGRAIPGVFEVTEVAMVAIVYLGIALAQRNKAHVSMSLVADRLPVRAAAVVRAVGLVVALAVLAWIAMATMDRALSSLASGEYRWGMVRVAIWPARMLIPITVAVLVAEILLDLVRLFSTVRHGAPAATGVQPPAPGAAPPMT